VRALRVALDPETLYLESDWMDVDPTITACGDLHSQWKPVRLNGVAETGQSSHACVVVVGVHSQVQIAVRPRLDPDERVDAPAASHPVTDSGSIQRIENFEHLIRQHVVQITSMSDGRLYQEAVLRISARPRRIAAEADVRGLPGVLLNRSRAAMMPSVKDVYPGDGDPDAVPGLNPTPQPKVDETWDRLEVDGETFAVRYDGRGKRIRVAERTSPLRHFSIRPSPQPDDA
jgi:hypothetical protein